MTQMYKTIRLIHMLCLRVNRELKQMEEFFCNKAFFKL